MRIVLTGGTGYVGRALARALLGRGDEVTILTRDPFADAGGFGAGPGKVHLKAWDPLEPGSWQSHLDGVDGVVHLAGEPVVGRRLTSKLERQARDSRIRTAELLVQAMRNAEQRPRVFVGGSAVGYYGCHHGLEPLDESAAAGDDFLARLCVDWERAEGEAEELGVRVVHARLGIVLGPDGGALEVMARPFRLGLGGPLGSGDQVLSWVSLDDAVQALLRCLDDENLRGAVNVVAPEAATNEQFTVALAQVLKRPAFVRVPEMALRLALGDGAQYALGGQRAVPGALEQVGFRWEHPGVRDALRVALRV